MSEVTPSAKTSPPPKASKRKVSSQADGTSKKRKKPRVSAKATSTQPVGSSAKRGAHEAAQESLKGNGNQQESAKTRQRKTLNKTEKLNVTERVKTCSSGTLCIVVMTKLGQQLPVNASEKLKEFCISLPVSSMQFFADQLKKQFVKIYSECATMADKYLKFQLQWHQHCSYYLVEYNRELSLIGIHPDDPIAVDVVSIRSKWHCIVKQYFLTKNDAKIFLILFCGCVYDELLRACHSAIEVNQTTTQFCSEDSDDVYYRFGGAAISSMLHSRYKQIKSCMWTVTKR